MSKLFFCVPWDPTILKFTLIHWSPIGLNFRYHPFWVYWLIKVVIILNYLYVPIALETTILFYTIITSLTFVTFNAIFLTLLTYRRYYSLFISHWYNWVNIITSLYLTNPNIIKNKINDLNNSIVQVYR